MPKDQKLKKQEEKEKETPEKEDDIYEQCSMIVYQKKNGGDWERVEIPYKRKKI